jgi:hypothetical protein
MANSHRQRQLRRPRSVGSRLYYVLDGRKILRAGSLIKWAIAFEKQRWVASTRVAGHRVSTVFLGIDHNFSRIGPPILFETMVFAGAAMADWSMRRYATYEEAEAGHRDMVAQVRAAVASVARLSQPITAECA